MMIRCCWVCLKKVQNCSLSWSMDIHNVGPGPQVQPHWAPPTVLRWLGASSVNHTGPQKRNSPRRSPLPAASKEEKGGVNKNSQKRGKKRWGEGVHHVSHARGSWHRQNSELFLQSNTQSHVQWWSQKGVKVMFDPWDIDWIGRRSGNRR